MFSSLISKFFNDLPSNFGYNIGEKVEEYIPSLWVHYRGFKKNKLDTPCSIFIYDKSSSTNLESLRFLDKDTIRRLVKTQFQRCRSLIHPSIIKVYDAIEVDNHYYIVTEPCISLYSLYLFGKFEFKMTDDSNNSKPYYIWFSKDCTFGIYDIMKSLKFLHNDAKLIHGNINPLNIYINSQGYWKLGGFEYCLPLHEASSNYIEDIKKWNIAYNVVGWKFPNNTRNPKCLDMWSLGALIYWYFDVSQNIKLDEELNIDKGDNFMKSLKNNKPNLRENILNLPYTRDNILSLEKNILPLWIQDWVGGLLTSINTGIEVSLNDGITLISRSSPIVELFNHLDEFQLKTDPERVTFCSQYLQQLILSIRSNTDISINIIIGQRLLTKLLDTFPQYTSNIFPIIISILNEFDNRKCPEFLLKPFLSTLNNLLTQNDRSIRYTILKNISSYYDFIEVDILISCIDPMVLGFHDTMQLIRETTLQSMIYIIPKLLSCNNNETESKDNSTLLKSSKSSDFIDSIKEGWKKNSAVIFNTFSTGDQIQIAVNKLVNAMFTLAKDPEVIVRSNTAICFAKLLCILPQEYHMAILNKVYLTVIKDNYPICRKAVLQALNSTVIYYPCNVITQLILPNVSIYGFIQDNYEIMQITADLIKHIAFILSDYVKNKNETTELNDINSLEAVDDNNTSSKDIILDNTENYCGFEYSGSNEKLHDKIIENNKEKTNGVGRNKLNYIGNIDSSQNLNSDSCWDDDYLFDYIGTNEAIKLGTTVTTISSNLLNNNLIDIDSRRDESQRVINLNVAHNSTRSAKLDVSINNKNTIKLQNKSTIDANLKFNTINNNNSNSVNIILNNDDFWKEFEGI
ncbi:HEAT repeat family protein [Cryptosporidium muris RN66]|uniref:HEAT repeat family protein n=1 Tax=Cryptosporidium muris (strain RN66) TaxID=441375 RepID=B6AB84_CRYMR|nr:HEAT repeat family protein [Cryptosporidium muris RN66]EEA05636.1 HEAT repeat family protein [Cryptosporidium muris RN66]|eukprot:XP_002139985.1 HEAT repeat family protein [Cryptosporidium muris RN66]